LYIERLTTAAYNRPSTTTSRSLISNLHIYYIRSISTHHSSSCCYIIRFVSFISSSDSVSNLFYPVVDIYTFRHLYKSWSYRKNGNHTKKVNAATLYLADIAGPARNDYSPGDWTDSLVAIFRLPVKYHVLKVKGFSVLIIMTMIIDQPNSALKLN